jgi:transposase
LHTREEREEGGEGLVDIIYERCCGLDVHKRSVAACLIVPGTHGEPRKEIRTFGTMTEDLLELSDWLAAAGCTHVAMESTGVYWKPIYNLLWRRLSRRFWSTPGTSRVSRAVRPT